MESVFSEEIFDFDDLADIEPIANEEEIAAYNEQSRIELEEEEMLRKRFSGELKQWCTCCNCSLTLITKKEECFCCNDIMRCMDKLNELDDEVSCIVNHPGFNSVCLDKYVLETAAVGLRTRKNRSYTVLREKGLAEESEFLRSVAYRQFFRFVWEFTGNSRRLPLPCCVYNIVRRTFPSDNGNYKGFLEEDERQQVSEDETESEEEEDLALEQ